MPCTCLITVFIGLIVSTPACVIDKILQQVQKQIWRLQDLDEEDLDASFEEYCQDIEGTAAWGGQTELNALAHVLQQPIKVYAAGLPVVDMGQQYQGTGLHAPCQLLHHQMLLTLTVHGFTFVTACFHQLSSANSSLLVCHLRTLQVLQIHQCLY